MLIRLHGKQRRRRRSAPTSTGTVIGRRRSCSASWVWATGRWCGGRSVLGQDGSSRPHRMPASLEDWQEELRTTMLLPLDDLLGAVRKMMKPTLTRSALNRCLVRHGAGSLRALRARLEDKPAAAGKRFKDYVSGFPHVDIKYLPRMSDKTRRRYLFVAIDPPPAGSMPKSLPTKARTPPRRSPERSTASLPTTARSSPTASPAPESEPPPDSIPSTGNAGNWTLSTASSPCEGRRPMAWSNASTDASPKSPKTTASTTPANCAPPSATTSIHTTTSSRSSRSDTVPPHKPSAMKLTDPPSRNMTSVRFRLASQRRSLELSNR